MSSGPNRFTEAYKARKRIRDARYRERNRNACIFRSKLSSYRAFVNRGSV